MPERTEQKNPYRKKAVAVSATLMDAANTGAYERPESSLRAPFDTKVVAAMRKKVAHLMGAKHVVLVGIGGSSQGVEAVYGALPGEASASLLVLDTIDDERMRAFELLLKKMKQPEDIAIVIISKSGATTETLANAARVLTLTETRFGKAALARTVMIGGASSPAAVHAKKHKVTWVGFPDTIGGRYSIFTAVGVVPLMLLGIDVTAFLEGARKISEEETLTGAAYGAASLAHAAASGNHTLDIFVFDRTLEGYARWYRQLLAESIGKAKTKAGKLFQHTLLPTVSSAIDLHSVAQLYFSGKRGIWTRFLDTERSGVVPPLGEHWILADVPSLSAVTPHGVMDAIRDGVILAYAEAGLPHEVLILRKRTAHEMGRIMAAAMAEVMVLARLFGVNAFDQPNVEAYKKHTRSLLGE